MSSRVIETCNGMPVRYIESDPELERVARGWLECSVIALDTEFMRVRTFHPQAALFQVCDGHECFLLDPLALEDLTPLAKLLAAPGVVKLMHSCSEDLEVCERRLGALPDPLVDTQVVAAFCGHPLSVGYQKILASELGVQLEKSETRTDWLKRPLSPAQIHYAAEDVAFLPALWGGLSNRLAATANGAWALAECVATLERFRNRDGADYRAVAGAWRLDQRALAVLRALHAWREDMARKRDLPRNWLLADSVLLEIARLQPRREEDLRAVAELPDGTRRRHADTLLELVDRAMGLPVRELPPSVPPPLSATQTRRAKRLRERTVTRAEELGMAPEMLARRRDFEELLRWVDGVEGQTAPAVLDGWRRAVIGEELLVLAREAGP
ncbi:MAG TPA: ribonuclease D [Pseudomonadales bacterium]|nr:ribonuclease D [Pseudomonadales bacterium]